MLKFSCVIVCFAMLTASAWTQAAGSPADDGVNDLERGGTPPRLLHADAVSYPDGVGLARIRHTCVISVVVGRDGKLRSAQLENTQPSPFDPSALESVRNATFSPATRDGQAVGARTQVWVEFRGDGQPALPSIDPGPGFERPRAKVSPIPEYTTEARKQGIRGNVLLSFVVTEDGGVTDILVLRHLGGGLDDQAVKTVQQWRFDPATLDGEAVPYRIKAAMSFNFR